MSEQILVRLYSVGCGDCILIRVPDESGPRHILIDCGNFFGDRVTDLRSAVQNVVEMLHDPDEVPEDRRGRLDLLVATHRHWDHLKGFEGALAALKGITIERIWMTVAMKEGHEGAERLLALQQHLADTMEIFAERGMTLNPQLHATLLLSLSTAEAARAVCEELPDHHGIEPLYAYRGVEDDLSPAERAEQLFEFDDPNTRISILAPEKDIDAAYMGSAHSLMEELVAGLAGFYAGVPEGERLYEPVNISVGSFRRLKSQLQYTSLMAASQENGVVNNTSVALLLEWRGRRLLFPGDAEYESWQLMWQHEREALSAPLNFLKISHHGSHNGTPYKLGEPNDPQNEILDTLLPEANAAEAQAVVSTLAGRIHAPIHPVPFPDLMNELAKRVSNSVEYPPEPGLQPQRTDRESGEWIDILIDPA